MNEVVNYIGNNAGFIVGILTPVIVLAYGYIIIKNDKRNRDKYNKDGKL